MEQRELGSSGVRVTRFALGCAPLGGLYEPVGEANARATVDEAWRLGVRTFDTAPHYGAGVSELRLGAALRGRPREELVLSTKVGRVLEEPGTEPAASMFAEDSGLERRFDFSADGVRRSLEDSLTRLGLDRADVVHVHDPDDHLDEAIASALPALAALRDEGVIGAVGAGMNAVAPLLRIVREADVDCILLAGRHTLLDQTAAEELLPLCLERGVSVIAAGVLNSGVLADPRDGATFDYEPASAAVLERARHIGSVCERHGVALPVAATAFPLRHAAVACVLVGARSAAEVQADIGGVTRAIPEALWADLEVVAA
ncbi:MAG TPA: aldo/keto reductase [Solirubrobacteraceae bacterium]|nr:aldo/keto reductase [Solirubrobacteraceae bacterium]